MVNYSYSFNLNNVTELSWNIVDRNGVQVKTENEKFAVMCSRPPQNLKFSHFRGCYAEDGQEMYQNL